MKKVHSKIIAILCAFLITFGMPVHALAANSQYEISAFLLDAVEDFLTTAVLPFSNEYELPNHSHIALGPRIPVYTYSEIKPFPLFV